MAILLSILATDIVPIVVVAMAGFVLARWFNANVRTLTEVVFHALLPCLVFRMLVTSAMTGSEAGRLIALSSLTMILTGMAGYAICRARRLTRAASRDKIPEFVRQLLESAD